MASGVMRVGGVVPAAVRVGSPAVSIRVVLLAVVVMSVASNRWMGRVAVLLAVRVGAVVVAARAQRRVRGQVPEAHVLVVART